MKYTVRVSELRYGEVVVEASNEEQTKTVASGSKINWYDSETTDMTAEPVAFSFVTEVCPHCENEIEMRWNTDTQGFKAFCPVCGRRLMLCDECLHDENDSRSCDYNSHDNACRRNKNGK